MERFRFDRRIDGHKSWGEIHCAADVFEPLASYIFGLEEISYTGRLENLTPGTNAVFGAEDMVIKIFAPVQSGFGSKKDYASELFGFEHAMRQGVAVPKLLAKGETEATGPQGDRYLFRYLIMERLAGREIGDVRSGLDSTAKLQTGRDIRELTRRLNVPVTEFDAHRPEDFLHTNERWSVFSDSFNRERIEYASKRLESDRLRVFVHGDITAENLLISGTGLYLIDFADCMIAPPEYELPPVLLDAAAADPDIIAGYMGADINVEKLRDDCFYGILLHDFGANIISDAIGKPEQLTDIFEVRERLDNILK